MRRISISSVAVAVLGVLVLASLLLFSGHNNESAEAMYTVSDPVPGLVSSVDIDMVDGGNTGSAVPGGVQSFLDSVPVFPTAGSEQRFRHRGYAQPVRVGLDHAGNGTRSTLTLRAIPLIVGNQRGQIDLQPASHLSEMY